MDGHLAGGLDGYEAMKKIRDNKVFFPFIFVSGYSREYLEKVKTLGPVACFSKPVQLDSLVEVISAEMKMKEPLSYL